MRAPQGSLGGHGITARPNGRPRHLVGLLRASSAMVAGRFGATPRPRGPPACACQRSSRNPEQTVRTDGIEQTKTTANPSDGTPGFASPNQPLPFAPYVVDMRNGSFTMTLPW